MFLGFSVSSPLTFRGAGWLAGGIISHHWYFPIDGTVGMLVSPHVAVALSQEAV